MAKIHNIKISLNDTMLEKGIMSKEIFEDGFKDLKFRVDKGIATGVVVRPTYIDPGNFKMSSLVSNPITNEVFKIHSINTEDRDKMSANIEFMCPIFDMIPPKTLHPRAFVVVGPEKVVEYMNVITLDVPRGY